MSYLKSRIDPSLFVESVPVEVETKVCTLEHLIGWLETKPPQEEYCWEDSGACLYAKYGEHIGVGGRSTSPYCAALDGFIENYGWSGGFSKVAVIRPHTYGAALSRARDALARS